MKRKTINYSDYSKKDLQNLIRKDMKKINRSVDLLKKDVERDLAGTDFLENTLSQFRTATKTKSKDKIATGNLSRFSKKQLIDIANLQQSYLQNPRSTKKGRKAIFEKQYATLKKSDQSLTRNQLRNFQQLMAKQTDLLHDIASSRKLDSEQLIEISKAFSADQVVKFSDNMMNNLGYEKINKIPSFYFSLFMRRGMEESQKNDSFDINEYYSKFMDDYSNPTTFSF